jgi:sugar phosphate isomerase/epimerase
MRNHRLLDPPDMERRTFIKTMGAAVALAGANPGAVLRAASTPPAVRFGVDMFSINRQGWTPFQMLDWASKWGVKVVHFSEIGLLGGLDPDHLKRVRGRADELGIDLEIGTRSICPTSQMFVSADGTAEEQLAKMVDAARIVRSPIVRCVLGSAADRALARGGIEAHIDDMVKVLKSSRSRVMDGGVKVSIENHAGDMQARELKMLVDAAGPEFVGVTLDSGNPVWTIEDPHLTLETLAPYVLTSHMRDSSIWMTPQGIASAWMRMGEGNIGIEDYLRTYVQKCPGRAVSLEVIVSGGPRIFNYHDPKAWEIYQKQPAWEFARFLALAEKGTAPPNMAGAGATARGGAAQPPSGRGAGQPGTPPQPASGRGAANPAAAARQLEDAEASIRWTKAFLEKL